MQIHRPRADVTVLADQAEIPGLGFLPVNAFVVHSEQPVVVDTGLSTPGTGFLDALGSVLDPSDVRWIYLTHPDRDHTGALFELLELAPQARLVTTFLGVGILGTQWEVPMDRVYLLNPGQTLDVGDRVLTAVRPPLFDNPATVGLFDHRTGTLLSSDCFGAPLPTSELAAGDDVGDVPADALRQGQLLWAAVDSPWVHQVDAERFRSTYEPIRALDPSLILSSHLPPSQGRTAEFLDMLAEAPAATPFVGPDQQALEALLASFEPDAPVPA